jgi:three-Cys-motif partner protein
MPLSDKPTYVIGDDGLSTRISGQWARRKHHYLRNYCGIATGAVGKKWPGGVVYLDVMAGPGRCREEATSEEFDGSPLVALKYDFAAYYFIEDHHVGFAALEERLRDHSKRKQIHLFNENWIDLVAKGELQFDARTLVVSFIDPTGISAVPMSAMQALMRNPHIDLLLTIQYALGIVLNARQFARSKHEETVLDHFLGSAEWRQWQWKDSSELARLAIEAFCAKIEASGFKGARNISVPEKRPLYRFAYFSRHERGTEFWNKILKFDEKGQPDLPGLT